MKWGREWFDDLNVPKVDNDALKKKKLVAQKWKIINKTLIKGLLSIRHSFVCSNQ